MEVVFDNKNNVLEANICSATDNAVLYNIKSTYGFRGRKVTVLKDANPPPGHQPNVTVGAILWNEKVFEVAGVKKKISEIKRKDGGLFSKTRLWKWNADRKEYGISHHHNEWKASLNNNMMIAGRFCIPFRPHLFTKSKPAVLHLTQTALQEDEVFLILVFIYSEARRQDGTNSSVGAGSEGW